MCFAVPAVRPRVDELNGVCLWLVRSCLLLLNLSKSSEWNACRSAAVPIRSICCNPILIRFHFLHYSMQFIHCSTVTLFSVYLYYYQMNHSVFWTITSTWPDLSIRGKKCPIGDDQLSQLSALSISIVWNVSTMGYATVVLLVRKELPIKWQFWVPEYEVLWQFEVSIVVAGAL